MTVDVHRPPQSTRPARQESAQEPLPLQISPAAQVVPGAAVQSEPAPQWARLVSGSMQVPPQLTRPTWQISWHTPAPLHTSPGAHAVLQSPQCWLSTRMFVQPAEHVRSGGGQVFASGCCLNPEWHATIPISTLSMTTIASGTCLSPSRQTDIRDIATSAQRPSCTPV